MALSILALDTFTFSISTAAYETLQRATSWEWADQKIVGAYPNMQYTGPEAETITLSGTVYPLFENAGVKQLDALRELAAKGGPLALADGSGRELGRWVILGVNEEQSNFLPGGVPRKQTFTISLKRYD